jgi:hypothetical protein
VSDVGSSVEGAPAGIGRNPFIGPRSIRRGEPIYGREHETNDICSTLVAARIVLLYAVSGAGKTSLLEAALRPELERRDFAVLPIVRVGHGVSNLNGGTASNRYVLSTLLSLEEGRPQETRLHPGELSAMSLEEYVSRCLVRGHDDALDPCFFFDQFEELFTLDPVDELAKRDFIGQLGVVLQDPGLWALFSMREDFIAQLDPYASMIPERWETRYRLELLAPAAAKRAIKSTVAGAGRIFTDDAAELLINDLRRVRVQRGAASVEELGPKVEPVQLQVVCRELWDRVDPQAISIEARDVKAAGDVNDALGRFYEDAVAVTSRRTGVPTYSLRRWFSDVLITPFGTRSMALQGPESTQDLPNNAVAALEDLHLIRAETRAGARWYELTHDRFIEPVQASNAGAHSLRLPSLWGVVPLALGFLAVIVLISKRTDSEGTAGAILYFGCGGLVGLGVGELLGTALDRDARRVIPRRGRRGWRLGLGVVFLLFAAFLLVGSVSYALSDPSDEPYTAFPTYVSDVTGFVVTGSPACNGTNLSVFTHGSHPDVTSVGLGSLPRSVGRDLARDWCHSEAVGNVLGSAVFLAIAVALATVVAITWRRRGRRRRVAPATRPLIVPAPEPSSAPASSGRVT